MSETKTDRTAPLDSVAIVENFWREVWQLQNPEAIDRLVHEDFVITSGGRDIVGKVPFKAWVKGFLAKVHDFQFHVVETFQNHDGSRVASRWRVTGYNKGLMGTQSNGAPIEMIGTAVWEVGPDGLLRHNWVERNAFEVYGAISREDGKQNTF
jgi:SnoaL-like polyketide cyclase